MSTANGFFQYLKGENQFGPLQVVTFYQPTTVDKEPPLDGRKHKKQAGGDRDVQSST